jgi:hypothetical protein
MGACNALGGNVMEDAFGCVALVAMAPIISIQLCGFAYKLKSDHRVRQFVSASETFIDYAYEPRSARAVYAFRLKEEGNGTNEENH